MIARALAAGALAALLAVPAAAAPTRSSPLAVAPDGVVFVVNPDQDTVARLVFGATPSLLEAPVGAYPRTVALAGTYVFTADQNGDRVTRLDQADLGNPTAHDLGPGCSPYGVAATPAGDRVVVTCQGTSEVVILDPGLGGTERRVKLDWPNARALAITADGAKAYVTHYLTEEPGTEAHVSVVSLGQGTVQVFNIPTDMTTCETQNSGHGPLNLLSAIAIIPAGPLAGQVWIGGTQENNINKGLFERNPLLAGESGTQLFPLATFTPFPAPVQTKKKRRQKKTHSTQLPGTVTRNKYTASFHDITRFGIYKLDGATGQVIGKLDIDEANNASDIEFSADGNVAYVVDQTFNSYHVLNTHKGQDGDVTTLFAAPSSFGPGGVDPSKGCIADALNSVTGEGLPFHFRMVPQAEIRTIDGYEPFDASARSVNTGVDFDTPTYMNTDPPHSQMRAVPDGVGTAPIGVRLAPDGQTAYVANYLARNVVPVATAQPLDGAGRPANLRCAVRQEQSCRNDDDCPAGTGFCNHPGGDPCVRNQDCGDHGPCVRPQDCVPMILGQPASSITGGIDHDRVKPAILDGKILFNTAARDSSPPNKIGLDSAAPLFNDATLSMNAKVPGSVVSTAHDASYVTCATCHADFGGQDGRTWDFSQFGASLRNTMDLRGRSSFAPGTCSNDHSQCFFDAACGDGNFCQADAKMVPPNIPDADKPRYFNPMVTIHWNGDRDEVEDFEHTYRSLMGAGDCDGNEHNQDSQPPGGRGERGGCMGALIQRSRFTSSDPADVNDDLAAPNRNIRGKTGKIVGIRLTHMADFVYSLTEFPRNPNPSDAAAERGRALFNDPQTKCAECHNGGPPGKQLFSDKRAKVVGRDPYDPKLAAGADQNNPFVRHDVNTANLFDRTNPNQVASASNLWQNFTLQIPGSRGALGEYVTPILNDVWNTAPYLHDGSAATLLDVIRPCDPALDDCDQAGSGRNVHDLHGVTSILTPRQLNDLAAFQKTLTTSTPIGSAARVVNAGGLDLSRTVISFGPQGHFVLAGKLSPPGPIDASAGVELSLAMPGGEKMVIVPLAMTMAPAGGGFVGRLAGNGGRVTLRVRDLGDGTFRFSASGSGVDLTSLGSINSRDLTVSLEIGGTAFVRNRHLKGVRRVFRLARKGKS
jgi:DNA-binding beta-propeller fold protein YncE